MTAKVEEYDPETTKEAPENDTTNYIQHTEKLPNGEEKIHRVPVTEWNTYEKEHGF